MSLKVGLIRVLFFFVSRRYGWVNIVFLPFRIRRKNYVWLIYPRSRGLCGEPGAFRFSYGGADLFDAATAVLIELPPMGVSRDHGFIL